MCKNITVSTLWKYFNAPIKRQTFKKKIHQNSSSTSTCSRVSTCSYMLHASPKKITSKTMSQNKKVFYYYFFLHLFDVTTCISACKCTFVHYTVK